MLGEIVLSGEPFKKDDVRTEADFIRAIVLNDELGGYKGIILEAYGSENVPSVHRIYLDKDQFDKLTKDLKSGEQKPPKNC